MKLLFSTLALFISMSSAQATEGELINTNNVKVSPLEKLERLEAEGEIILALMCFKSGERVSGMNKICYYDCAGSTAAITVGAAELCPLSINN